jgi:hypothetical protein
MGQPADDYIFFLEVVMLIVTLVQAFSYSRDPYQQRRVKFTNDRMSFNSKGRLCDIILLNVHEPTEDKNGDKELERVFYQFPKNHVKILLDFNEKVRREDILKPMIWTENLHEIVMIIRLE